MENKKIIGRLVKIEIVVEISMKYQKAINYKTHINVGINYNMRCIETRKQGKQLPEVGGINYNMRCIETLRDSFFLFLRFRINYNMRCIETFLCCE